MKFDFGFADENERSLAPTLYTNKLIADKANWARPLPAYITCMPQIAFNRRGLLSIVITATADCLEGETELADMS